jgi:hypothetical protein
MTAYKDWCERAPLAHLPQYNRTSLEWQGIASTGKIKSNSRILSIKSQKRGKQVQAPTQ